MILFLYINTSNHLLIIKFISFFGLPKMQSYFALISARINNAQMIIYIQILVT